MTNLNDLLVPLTYTATERAAYRDGYTYGTLRFDVDNYSTANEERIKKSLGNALRRWLKPENHAVSLVIEVRKTVTDPTTNTASIQTIASVPVITIAYTESGGVSDVSQVMIRQQLVPWFRITPGDTLQFVYTVRSSQDSTSQVADKVVELGKTVATVVGQQAGWVLSKLTSPAITGAAEKVDAEIAKAFSFTIESSTGDEIGVLRDADMRKGYLITLRGGENLPTAQLKVTVDFRQSLMTDGLKTGSAVPNIEPSPSGIMNTRFGPAEGHTIRELFEGQRNRDWFRLWQGQSGANFAAGCRKTQQILIEEGGLANYDVAAGLWAVLTTNPAFMETPALHDTSCLDPAMKSRLAVLEMSIAKPAGRPPEREVTITEMDATLNKVIGLMKMSDEANPSLFIDGTIAPEVTVRDEKKLLQPVFSSAVTVNARDALQLLRNLKPDHAGCFVSYASRNSTTRTMLVKTKNVAELRRVDAVFDTRVAEGRSVPITAMTVDLVDDAFLADVVNVFTERDEEGRPVLDAGGQPKVASCSGGWRPWEEAGA